MTNVILVGLCDLVISTTKMQNQANSDTVVGMGFFLFLWFLRKKCHLYIFLSECPMHVMMFGDAESVMDGFAGLVLHNAVLYWGTELPISGLFLKMGPRFPKISITALLWSHWKEHEPKVCWTAYSIEILQKKWRKWLYFTFIQKTAEDWVNNFRQSKIQTIG